MEFALVLPLVAMLVFGVIQYSLYFWAKQGGASAARDAARRSAVGDYAACAELTASTNAQVDRFGELVSVTRTYSKGPGNALPATQIGDIVTIEVTFSPINLNLPLVPVPATVTESVASRVEYVPGTIAGCA